MQDNNNNNNNSNNGVEMRKTLSNKKKSFHIFSI